MPGMTEMAVCQSVESLTAPVSLGITKVLWGWFPLVYFFKETLSRFSCCLIFTVESSLGFIGLVFQKGLT